MAAASSQPWALVLDGDEDHQEQHEAAAPTIAPSSTSASVCARTRRARVRPRTETQPITASDPITLQPWEMSAVQLARHIAATRRHCETSTSSSATTTTAEMKMKNDLLMSVLHPRRGVRTSPLLLRFYLQAEHLPQMSVAACATFTVRWFVETFAHRSNLVNDHHHPSCLHLLTHITHLLMRCGKLCPKNLPRWLVALRVELTRHLRVQPHHSNNSNGNRECSAASSDVMMWHTNEAFVDVVLALMQNNNNNNVDAEFVVLGTYQIALHLVLRHFSTRTEKTTMHVDDHDDGDDDAEEALAQAMDSSDVEALLAMCVALRQHNAMQRCFTFSTAPSWQRWQCDALLFCQSTTAIRVSAGAHMALLLDYLFTRFDVDVGAET